VGGTGEREQRRDDECRQGAREDFHTSYSYQQSSIRFGWWNRAKDIRNQRSAISCQR
jgi:hypothetical protein